MVEWREDKVRFIIEALGPADIDEVILDEDSKSAKVIVKDSQLSLAIGKEGQNARLAAKLTGYKIDIEGLGDSPPEEEEPTKKKNRLNGKKRIHQIAKELDIASADVLHKAKELGFEVKTASSGLIPEDEELLKLAISEEFSDEDIDEENINETEEEATHVEEEEVSDKDETNDEADNVDINIIEVTEGSTPQEIATIFDLDATSVVADLMSLGIMQSLTSNLSNDEI